MNRLSVVLIFLSVFLLGCVGVRERARAQRSQPSQEIQMHYIGEYAMKSILKLEEIASENGIVYNVIQKEICNREGVCSISETHAGFEIDITKANLFWRKVCERYERYFCRRFILPLGDAL